MTLPRPATPDALRPSEEMALDAWASRVRAADEQVERCRGFDEPTDHYASGTSRFRLDPRRSGDVVLKALQRLSRPDDVWLDIGAGGGRFALPLAFSLREVLAIEPSPAMLAVLVEDMRVHGIENIDVRAGRWPPENGESSPADVALMSHVGYGVEDIGAFLDAAEAAATRTCVAVMGEGPMTTAATLLWEAVHGELRVPSPAFPEMLALLMARGRFPHVSAAPRYPVVYDTLDGVLGMAHRQLRVRAGSAKDEILHERVISVATQRESGWSLDWSTTRIGIASWEPTAI